MSARRIAAVVLVDARGWLLLQERDEHAPVNPDEWSLVGGGVEPGETYADAAVRELEEETEVTGVDLDPLGRLHLLLRRLRASGTRSRSSWRSPG